MSRWFLAAGLTAVFALGGSARAGDDKKDPPKQEKQAKPDDKAKVDLDALFKKLDADGDGKISAEEFKKLPELYKPQPPRTGGRGQFDPEMIRKLLEKFGKGGAGKLDPEMIRKLLEKFGKGGAGNIDLDALKKLLEQLKKPFSSHASFYSSASFPLTMGLSTWITKDHVSFCQSKPPRHPPATSPR
jgi:hypothetical protein